MATAAEYAAWIVQNKAKQGTPEFNTVAQAYEMAKSQENMSAQAAAAPPVQPEPSIGQRIGGAIETGATLVTGATGGMLGGLLGGGRQMASDILSGRFGTEQSNQMIQAAAGEGARALTYEPRSATAREMAAATGKFLQTLPPYVPVIGPAGAIASGVSQARPAVSLAAREAGATMAAPIQRAAQTVGLGGEGGIGRRAPAGGSVGAAATPLELQRATEAEMAGLRLTEGEVKRSPELLAFEKEKAKTPEYQAPFLERQQENNRAALAKLNQILDDTGAEAGDYSNTGIKTVDALMAGWKAEKRKTSDLYNKFKASPEAQTTVDITPVMDFMNSQPRNIANQTGVTDVARQNAINFGIAQVDEAGNLVANPNTTLGQLEEFRKSVSATSAAAPNDKRLIVLLKNSIDEVGDPIGGAATKAMRLQRQRQAQKYENRAIVSRLLLEKKGMSDPQTPIEDVFKKTILDARPSEIQHIKRVLFTIKDDDGKRAWGELQGATVRHLLEKAEAGIGADNLPVISGAKLNTALKALDQNGKLDLVMGKPAAEQIRNLNQVLQYIQSTPPLTSINNSGTARTVAALIAESAMQGAVFGVPVPVVQGMKMLRDNIKDREIKAKINKALNYKPPGTTANP
jgi:hypothetical protein